MSNTPEGRIKRKVVEVLKKHSVWYFFPASNGFGRAGIPDIIGIIDGRFLGIEVKSDVKKKPTALQVKCGEEIRAAGGIWLLVRSKEDADALGEMIEELRSERTNGNQTTESVGNN